MTELYVYQIIHLRAGEPRFLGRHVELLHDAARALFGEAVVIPEEKIRGEILRVVEQEKYALSATAFVRLIYTEAGRVAVLPEGRSLYEGYALRSVHPRAITMEYEMPMRDVETSAGEMVLREARCVARVAGAETVLRCDRDGMCRGIEGHPVIAIYHGEVIAPTARGDVAYELALRAAEYLSLRINRMSFSRHDLSHFEEVMWADHRGITALGHIDGYPLMALTAEKLCAAMELLAQQ